MLLVLDTIVADGQHCFVLFLQQWICEGIGCSTVTAQILPPQICTVVRHLHWLRTAELWTKGQGLQDAVTGRRKKIGATGVFIFAHVDSKQNLLPLAQLLAGVYDSWFVTFDAQNSCPSCLRRL